MRRWFRLALTVPAAALCLSACVPVRYTAGSGHVKVVSETLVLVDLSLGLFLDLASRLVQEPAAAPRLLQTDPRDPSGNLRSLGIDFEAFRKRLAEDVKVRPMILFVPHGADLVAAARSHDLEVDSWLPSAPPAVLSGPEVDVLIVFEDVASEPGGAAGRGAVALTRIASLSGLASLALTPEQRAKESQFRALPGHSTGLEEICHLRAHALHLRKGRQTRHQADVSGRTLGPLDDRPDAEDLATVQPGLRPGGERRHRQADAESEAEAAGDHRRELLPGSPARPAAG